MTKKEKAVEGNEKIAALLNRIMEYELAGVVRYTQYSLMVFGYNRLPIISWLSGQADEPLAHAHKAGEMITHIGGHPSLQIGRCWKRNGDRRNLPKARANLASYAQNSTSSSSMSSDCCLASD